MTTTTSNDANAAPASLSQMEQDEIRNVFELFDVDGKGKIDAKELQQVLESLEMNDAALRPFREALLKYKGKDDQLLDLESFQRLVLSKRHQSNKWRSVFDMFDTQHKGYITKDNLQQVAQSLGETLSDEELEEMMDRASHSQKGKVTFSEFEAIMTKNLFSSS